MKDINEQIKYWLNKIEKNVTDYRNKKTENKGHIYFDLENEAIKSKMSTGKISVMFYLFNQYEACLSLYRKRDVYLADYMFSNLKELAWDIRGTVYNGMQSLYYGVAAYRDYTLGNYLESLAKLNLATSFSVLQCKTIPRFFIDIQELWLNKLRVIVKTSSFNEATFLSEVCALFSFCYSGVLGNKDLSYNKNINAKDDLDNEMIFIINQLFVLLGRLTNENKLKDSFYTVLLNNLYRISNTFDENCFYEASIVLKIMNAAHRSEKNDLIKLLVENIGLVTSLPAQIKGVVTNSFLPMMN